MTTIAPPNEKTKKAVAWISEETAGGKKCESLIEDACVRFCLGPLDEEFLHRFFKEQAESGQGNG